VWYNKGQASLLQRLGGLVYQYVFDTTGYILPTDFADLTDFNKNQSAKSVKSVDK
jgi:hypothetical protein